MTMIQRILMAAIIFAGVPYAFSAEEAEVKESVNLAADEVKVEIDRLEVEDNIYTPFYRAETGRENEQGASKKWIRLAVEYTTEGGWIDELTIRYYAYSPEISGREPVLLESQVTYLNVGPGQHVGYVYLHPSYVERYQIRAADLDMAVNLSIAQTNLGVRDRKRVASQETTKQVEEGWSKLDYDIVARGHLLNRAETPFWFIDYDDHEIIKSGFHRHQEP